MAARRQPLLEHVHRLAARLDPEADAVLLERFARRHDNAAFEALVRRHGAMVLGVCRRVLSNDHDAEDVFQATFLVLARKAANLRSPNTLSAWLHGTARRLALKHRQTQKRRQDRETSSAQTVETARSPDPLEQLSVREMFQALDEELQRLPESYRLPLLLCCLEGRTQDEAADILGWTPDSVRGRLHRGRALLHARLARRGLALGMGLLAATALEQGVATALPARLTRATVEAAVHFAVGGKAGIAAGVLTLAEGAMRLTGLKMVAVLLGAVLAVSAGGVLARQIGAQEESGARPRVEESGKDAETVSRPELGDKTTRVDRYGDPLPPGSLARLGTVRLRHRFGQINMAFTRDGKGLITAGPQDPARLWDVVTGRMLRPFGDSQDNRIHAVALSPDGHTLAGRMWPTGDVGLWDVATGKLVRRLKGGQAQTGGQVVYSPDGKTVASAGDHEDRVVLHLWEAATGKELWTVKPIEDNDEKKPFALRGLTYSADGKSLIWGSSHGKVHLWDAATGKELRCWTDEKKRAVSALACSPNGRLFAAYDARRDGPKVLDWGVARLWDLATGKEMWQQQRESEKYATYGAAFSPDGKVLATSGYQEPIRLWDAATGKELRRCVGQTSSGCLVFSPDGKTLASGGRGQQDQTVHLWDVASGQEIRCIADGHEGTVCCVAFTPDGKEIVSRGWDRSLRVWDAATAEQRRRLLPSSKGDEHLADAILASVVASDGKTFAVVVYNDRNGKESKPSLTFCLWDRDTGRELRRWSQKIEKTGVPSESSLVLSPDGKIMACMMRGTQPNSQVYLWETATGKELTPIPGGYPTFSPDGKLLVTASIEERPRRGRKEPRQWHWSLTLWESATVKKLCSVPLPMGLHLLPGRFFAPLLFSPDGRMLATASYTGGGQANGMIHLWPLVRNESYPSAVRVGPPHLLAADTSTAEWDAWAFSPDSRTLALSEPGGAIRLLETATGKERARFTGHRGRVLALSFAPDGRRLVSGSVDTTILVWDVTGRLQSEQGASTSWSLRPAQLSNKELAKLWADLAANDVRRAGHTIWTLAAAPAQAVPYLKEHLQTSTKETKALLAQVPQRLRDLDDDAFTVREKAKAGLARLGIAAEPAMREALEKKGLSVETRRSLEQLLKTVESSRQAPLEEALRNVRALEVLEHIGTREARAALKALTADGEAESSLTQEARIALERLERTERR